MLVSSHKLPLEVGAQHEPAFINELIDVCDRRICNARLNLQGHKLLRLGVSSSVSAGHSVYNFQDRSNS